MSEKNELTLKESLNIAAQLCSHIECSQNREEIIETIFELAVSIQEKYADITRHHPSRNVLPNKSDGSIQEQHRLLSQINELQQSLR